MLFDYMLPLKNGNFKKNLLEKSEQVMIESASLAGNHTTQLLAETEQMNNIVNCYYSNELKFKNINISIINDAISGNFSENFQIQQVQDLCLCYLKFKDECEKYFKYQVDNFYVDGDILPRIHKTLSYHPSAAISKDANLFIQHETFTFDGRPTSTKCEGILNAISLQYFLNIGFGFNNTPASILILDGMLSNLKGYNLWSLSRGLFFNSKEYKNMRDFGDLTTFQGITRYLHFILDIALEQISFIKEKLKIDTLQQNLLQHIVKTREEQYDGVALPKYAELLLKELLIRGEIPRGAVKDIIGTEIRTATELVRKLIKANYIQSTTAKGNIRLKFNEKLITDIFADLII